MCEKSEILQGNEVISVSQEETILINHSTFTVDEFKQKLSTSISNVIRSDKSKIWCTDGVTCKLLSPQRGWREGTIKISLEFIPDEPEINEPESCLDDIRREIQKM